MADNNGVLASAMDITKLKVPDLKKELKNRGLNTSGNKNELLERLQNALNSSEKASNESVDDLEEDLLNEDDEDVHDVEASESVIGDLDHLTENLTPKKGKRKLDDSTANGNSKISQPIKKVILNRNNPVITDKRISTESKDGSDKTSESAEDKKIIKLSNITVKERLEMRAKKFEVPLSSAAKKIARAERFGMAATASSKNNNNNKINTDVNTSLDVLKQRAARFGGSVSTAMSSLEVQERLEKRKARFGIVTDSEKAKQRLERFKQPVK